ncbi:hypothetical protein HY798_04260 [Candidatus Falkowbacteria bacterium]|nr:hypothetical protein [Candidatus Falkowbacteria bacterium]
MKLIFKKLLQYYLKYITKLVIFIHHPFVIVIAGSTNKTFAKEEIVRILAEKGIKARSNPKSFNTEIGLPLAILNLPSGYHSYLEWLPIIIKAPFNILRHCRSGSYSRPSRAGAKSAPTLIDVLVLELGVSEPGDMKYLLSIIKPEIAVITDITQRYLDAFGDMDELAGEYEYLAKTVKKNGLLILNYDNLRVKNMAKVAKAKIETFGLKDGAGWQAAEIKKIDDGQQVVVAHGGVASRHEIKRFGEHQLYCLLIGLIIASYVQEKKKILFS